MLQVHYSPRFAGVVLAAYVMSMCWGCGDSGSEPTMVHGRVLCGGQVAENGSVRFVPIRDTHGAAATAQIREGEYRIEARGGIPVGWYRVEVVCQRNTGRKIPDRGVQGAMTDEWVPVSDDRYAGEESPLEIEVTTASDGQYDLNVPRRSK